MSAPPYEIIIGLETHVQLKTRSKLFSRVSTAFGAPPNTQTSPVCIGMPGTLPVMNREAFRLALKAALALNCRIPRFTKWDRKHYYYPDLPKNYQISQYDLPLSRDGYLEISDPKGAFPPRRIGIIRAHLEEDAGKSMHDEAGGRADSRIDLNRAGTPLLEIVSRPDLRSPREAKAYLTELKLLMSYLDVSDCNMEEGSLRVDANINLHIPTPEGVAATPIVEVKNMNSFRAVERALAYEAERQYAEWRESGVQLGDAPKQTRGWDEHAEVTRAQRHKEESSDYRYFPDPDLTPVIVTQEEVEQIRASLGELPADARRRLRDQLGVDPEAADVMVAQGRGVVAYFDALRQACGDAHQATVWVTQHVLRALNQRNTTIDALPVRPDALGELIRLVDSGQLDSTRAKDVFEHMVDSGRSAPEAIKALGVQQLDRDELLRLCRELLAANPKIVADLKNGKLKAVGALIGQAKRRNPNANPNQVRSICLELVESM